MEKENARGMWAAPICFLSVMTTVNHRVFPYTCTCLKMMRFSCMLGSSGTPLGSSALSCANFMLVF
jgi:hypothetical protein